jgi:hypothetical protein
LLEKGANVNVRGGRYGSVLRTAKVTKEGTENNGRILKKLEEAGAKILVGYQCMTMMCGDLLLSVGHGCYQGIGKISQVPLDRVRLEMTERTLQKIMSRQYPPIDKI